MVVRWEVEEVVPGKRKGPEGYGDADEDQRQVSSMRSIGAALGWLQQALPPVCAQHPRVIRWPACCSLARSPPSP